MRYYFAPMEGVTGYIYRNLHQKWFGGVDKYFTPFVSPSTEHCITKREMREIARENNPSDNIIPQILTKNAEDFIWLADKLFDMGYGEVNLNLGCPSGTVTAKGKGAGFLAKPDELDAFLFQIFEKSTPKISIKTRVGTKGIAEFQKLLKIFNQYPMEELIIHPRLQMDFYKGNVRIECFEQAKKESKNPLCYNGDMVSKADILAFEKKFPEIESIMIGRGLIANPALALWTENGQEISRENLGLFHDELYQAYSELFQSKQNAMFRMKEMWFYMIHLFDENEKLEKKLRKEKNPEKFEQYTAEIFETLPLRKDAAFGWYRA